VFVVLIAITNVIIGVLRSRYIACPIDEGRDNSFKGGVVNVD
jgi:hypothetical protein